MDGNGEFWAKKGFSCDLDHAGSHCVGGKASSSRLDDTDDDAAAALGAQDTCDAKSFIPAEIDQHDRREP
jgi:hypothetical protein